MKITGIILFLFIINFNCYSQYSDSSVASVDYEYAIGYMLPVSHPDYDENYTTIDDVFIIEYDNGKTKGFENKSKGMKKKLSSRIFLMDVINQLEQDGYELFTTYSKIYEKQQALEGIRSYPEFVFRRIKK